uniref:Uncharacterized protein n=1 Tax=Micrurus lemniscatus lemniscatus TaxID=129467 RepID=A0A2D4JMB7_MICLE
MMEMEKMTEPKMDLYMFGELHEDLKEIKEMLNLLMKVTMESITEQKNLEEENNETVKRDQDQETVSKNIKETEVMTLMISLIKRRRKVLKTKQKKKKIHKKKFPREEQKRRREKRGEELEEERHVQGNLVKGKLVKIKINNKIRNFRDKG